MTRSKGFKHTEETRRKMRENHAGGFPPTDLSKVLVENSDYARHSLKRQLISTGLIPYVCACCGNKGEWQGEKLSLHLDHKNGINNDNRIENLRFLCPNCHAQQPTYAGKNKARLAQRPERRSLKSRQRGFESHVARQDTYD